MSGTLEIGSSPHVTSGGSVEVIMRNVVWALLPDGQGGAASCHGRVPAVSSLPRSLVWSIAVVPRNPALARPAGSTRL